MDEPIVILCTAPDEATAQALARGLVEARLAACVSALPGLTSIYRWKGELETAREVQLLVKTRRAQLDAAGEWIRAHHPYEVPEILALPVVGGSEAYLAWLRAESSPVLG